MKKTILIMNNTFSLIKSLTSLEKREISVYLNRHNHKKVQLNLFQVLVKQQSYKKEKIIVALAKKTSYKSRYEVLEYALQQTILKYLRIISRTKKIKYQLSELVDIADILFEKGLYTLSLNKIKEGIRLAKEIDDCHFLSQLIDLQRKIQRILQSTNTFSEDKYHQEITKHLNELLYSNRIAFRENPILKVVNILIVNYLC